MVVGQAGGVLLTHMHADLAPLTWVVASCPRRTWCGGFVGDRPVPSGPIGGRPLCQPAGVTLSRASLVPLSVVT